MHTLQTAILEHTTAQGVHHDWLIEDPRLPDPKSPAARLWTARVTPPPQDWPQLKQFNLTVLPPHRRAYLTYQGPISNNRGRVKRLASGTCQSKKWSDHHILITLQCDHLRLDLNLTCQSGEHWMVVVEQACTMNSSSLPA